MPLVVGRLRSRRQWLTVVAAGPARARPPTAVVGAPRVRPGSRTARRSSRSYGCVAQLGGKLLRGGGKGSYTFKLPKNAKGKRLRVSLFVTYGGITDEFDPYVFEVR